MRKMQWAPLQKLLNLRMRRVVTSWAWCHKTFFCSQRFCGRKASTDSPLSKALGFSVNETFPEKTNAYEKIKEQIRGLSEEDRRLIFSALAKPEEQPNSKMGGPGIGTKSGDMVAAFTCGRCEFRMVKKFSKHAYTKGIVIIQCPSCEVQHLLADNLGWFVDEAKNIEDLLREKGESFVRIGNDYQVEPPADSEGPDTKK